MKILVVNSTYRPKGTTTELARSFMQGAESSGAEVDMIMLQEKTINYCTNCLKCYSFTEDGIAPCILKDDMDEIISRIVESEGVLFASPVHNGFVTGLMTVFLERLVWRVCRSSSPVINCMGLESRVNDKVRALGSIVSAGGMPERLRKFCDGGTPWLKDNATLMLHGHWIGDIYAGAELEHLPQSDQDWKRLYFLRRLSKDQQKRAHKLGVSMVKAIKSGGLKPVTMEKLINPALRWSIELYCKVFPNYRLAGGRPAEKQEKPGNK
ncbi:flavodoxin family protein [Desulfonatronospira sp.]|uniref:flavodoxin family protein n=1 Tax=Desulfonatronospira sp. TaxID=1962951 RepID=UPI0025C2C50B|nr:flavodoxin family protein [Desulfonatronospira sp.]